MARDSGAGRGAALYPFQMPRYRALLFQGGPPGRAVTDDDATGLGGPTAARGLDAPARARRISSALGENQLRAVQ
jgi:hypothetical protein